MVLGLWLRAYILICREEAEQEGGGREGERERERILLNFYEVTITTSPKTGKDSTTKQNK